MASGVSEVLSWSMGPANSRLVRVLLYLAEGFVGGFFLYQIISSIWVLAVDEIWIPLIILFILFFPVLLERIFIVYLVHQRENRRTTPFAEEWLEVRRWRWTFVVAAVVVASLIGVGILRVGIHSLYSWFLYEEGILVEAVLFAGLLLALFAVTLSSRGEISPSRKVLKYGENEIDLTNLASIEYFSGRRRTFLWLSFESKPASSVPLLYLIPTDVVKQARPILEARSAPQAETEKDKSPRHKGDLIGGLVLIGLGFATFAFLFFLGVPLILSILVGSMFAMFGMVALVAVIFGYK